MNFELKIVSAKAGTYSVDLPGNEIGFEGITIIREQIGVPVNISRIVGNIASLRKDYMMILDEDKASKISEWYKDKNTYTVSVDNAELNPFFYRKATASRIHDTDEITEVKLSYAVDVDEIFDYVYRKYYLKEPVDAKMMAE